MSFSSKAVKFFFLCSLIFAGRTFAGLGNGEIILVGYREVAWDRTEVRFKCPPGSVITGIGARAHLDNITTLWIFHRPVLGSGKLGTETEIHLGSEPDHACEALIRLPDPYVACGFGARGAPEWDVTTLWVWARPLLPDGTLGPVRLFKDGFEPQHGLERKAVEDSGERILTGAGLRFSSNDVAGIWASSAKPFEFEGDSISVKGVYFSEPSAHTAASARKLLRFFPGIKEFWVPGGPAASLGESLSGVRVRPVSPFELDDPKGRLVGTIRLVPALIGPSTPGRVNPFLEALAAGRKSPGSGEETCVAVQTGEELDPEGRLPYAPVERLSRIFLLARKAGLPVVLCFVSGETLTCKDSFGTLTLSLAQGLLGEKPEAPASLVNSWVKSNYGDGGKRKVEKMQGRASPFSVPGTAERGS